MKRSKEILIERIQNGISKPFSDELVKLIKPAIRLRPQEYPTKLKSFSKFGGIPQMKKEETWLTNPVTKHPYVFLLQLDLEDIKVFDIAHQLPKEGLLTFWFDQESWDKGKIVYYKNKSDLVKANLPSAVREEEERQKLPFWKRIFTTKNSFQLFPEHQLSFEIEYHCPSWDSLQIESFHLKHNTKPKDLEIDEKYIDDYCHEKESDHHLFGYYIGLQTPIYELMKTTNGRLPDKLTEDLINKGLQWKLLLQVDSDKITGMRWADWGKILFFIKESDLIIGNFDNLIVQVDTT